MLQYRLWGSLSASLFCAVCLLLTANCFAYSNINATSSLQEQALKLHLDQSQIWQALLHTEQQHPRITDPTFLLSKQQFSVRAELLHSIQMMQKEPDVFQCRFPARDYWLRSQLGLPQAEAMQCSDLKAFIEKAPIQTLSVVYAAENLNSASSMMGHVLFKLSGQTADGRQRDHAISFYTEVQGVNIPKILYDSVIRGKTGYFALSPYQEKIQYYTQNEQRNVWIYDLDLNAEQRRLIQYHLWELRQTQLRYFFTKYNCATFSQLILALSDRASMKPSTAWKSPLDLVKQIHQANLVKQTQFYPSARARVRMLSEQQSNSWKQGINHAYQSADLNALPVPSDSIEDYRILKTAQAYARYQQEIMTTPPSASTLNFAAQVDAKLTQYEPEFSLDLTDYKNPIKAPKDSQWYLNYQQFSDQPEQIRIGGFAASHRLEDDQSQALNNSELRLMDVALAWQPKNKRLRLEHFDLYAMTSLVPHDSLTGGMSTRIRIGYASRYEPNLDAYKAAFIQAGYGRSYRFANDLNFYVMINSVVDYGHSNVHIEVNPEIGVVIDAVYNMKSILSLTRTQLLTQKQQGFSQFDWTHAIPFNPNQSLVFQYTQRWNGSEHQYESSVGFKQLF